MQRILVIGCPGGGKTTFARTLGDLLNIPVHHLDKHFWKENWTPTPQNEFREIQNQLMKEERWIIEGNFTKSLDNRVPNADTIIVLDLPKLVNIWRTLKRFIEHFGSVRPEMGGENKEALQWKHIKYIVTIPRKEYLANIRSLAERKEAIVLRSPREVSEFLTSLRSQVSQPAV